MQFSMIREIKNHIIHLFWNKYASSRLTMKSTDLQQKHTE